MDADMTALSQSLVVEIAGAFGFRDSPLAHWIIRPLFRPITDRLARIGVTFDRNAARAGFSRAMELAMDGFVRRLTVRGAEGIPSREPLLVVSNHPGTYDSLMIASQLRRDDLRIISSDIPFVMKLPHVQENFFFISPDKHNRMVAARRAIRHLDEGGAVMVFGYGHLDPDPAVYEDAPIHIEQWSSSIELFLKTVPTVRLLISIVSHVVSAKWRHSLLYWLRRKPLDRRRFVEFGQVMTQLLYPGKLLLSPFLSFSPPITVPELCLESGSERVLPAVIASGKALLADHMKWAKLQSTRDFL